MSILSQFCEKVLARIVERVSRQMRGAYFNQPFRRNQAHIINDTRNIRSSESG